MTTARQFVGYVEGTSAPTHRDRRVAVRGVVCPECSAPVGEPCVSASGVASHVHRSRRRIAVRTEPEFSADDVLYAACVGADRRFAVRKRVFRSARLLAAHLGVSAHTLRRWEEGATPTGAAGARYGAWLREHIEGRTTTPPTAADIDAAIDRVTAAPEWAVDAAVES